MNGSSLEIERPRCRPAPEGCWWWFAMLFALAASSIGDLGRAAEPPGRAWIRSDGQSGTGRLLGIDSQWQLSFATDRGKIDIPARQLVRWGAWRDSVRGVGVILADGGILHVEDWRWDADTLVLPATTTGIWREARWPRSSVRGMIFQWPATRGERDRLIDRLATGDVRQDEVWLDSGDRMQGTVRWSEPPDTGAAAPTAPARDQVETSPLTATVTTRNGDVMLARRRIAAVAYQRSRREDGTVVHDLPSSGAWIGFRDGSCLQVRRIVDGAAQLQLELVAGAKLDADADLMWADVRFVQPWHDDVIYLSDLEPIGYKHVPFLAESWNWVRDGNVLGGRLRSVGNVYRKGLGMHSSSRLAYDVPPGFATFQAELAIDEAAGRDGSVICRVYLDQGDGSWRLAFESAVVRGGMAPLPVTVQLRGAQRMALIVDFADRGDQWDHADWLDARLAK